jgi:prepilin-type N-terminal cleavage/methylation domain-containing protein
MKLFASYRKTKKSGFTLLELLVVIAVASILVSIASASYTTAQKKARDARRMGDMKAVQNAAEQFYADNIKYPTLSSTFGVKYLRAGFPVDPQTTNTQYVYTASPAGCNNLPAGTNCTGYTVCADIEGTNGNATSIGGANFGTTGGFYCAKNLQ